MHFSVTGGCLCGAIRYRIARPVESALICHCQTCRRASGAPMVAWVTVETSAFAWLTVQPIAYESSPGVVRTHCGICGTSLTYQSDQSQIDVTTASLDAPEAFPPDREVWLEHRLPWAPTTPSIAGYARSTNEG